MALKQLDFQILNLLTFQLVLGFVVIKNPFEAGYQRYWVQRCLVDFPVKPNTTNIDAHMERPSHVWESCLSEKGYFRTICYRVIALILVNIVSN